MNPMEDGATINERLAELEQKLAALQAERATAAEQRPVHTSASPEKALGRKRESRRSILGKGLGVAAASLGAVALLDVGTGTALANGTVSTGTAVADATQGPTLFVNNGTNDIPVFGYSTSTADGLVGVSTGSHGVVGVSNSTSSFGVLGIGNGNLTSVGAAVAGFALSTTDIFAVAVYGNGQNGYGVFSTAPGSIGIGVEAHGGDSAGGFGVNAFGQTGVSGTDNSGTGTGIFGMGSAAVSGAGLFVGDVQVTGTLTKGMVNFKIDHPQDPANKYLTHSCVESPDIKNVYDGVATLDAQGEAVVTFPAWFGALNKDFRYQLTSIGVAGPNLHIATEISNNSFKIAGGTNGMQVSWQVTGIRQDAFALANPLVVEQNKSAKERGRYLHPTLHGHTASESIVTLPNAAKRKPVAPYKVPVVPIPGSRR